MAAVVFSLRVPLPPTFQVSCAPALGLHQVCHHQPGGVVAPVEGTVTLVRQPEQQQDKAGLVANGCSM
jgi:hypothetical protein